jgi:glycosyltransferase involved in cell wall biosynthesis
VTEHKISIGLLAHNEAARLRATLISLFEQNIFQKFATEVLIVANGCKDDTVAVANQLLADYTDVWSPLGSARVVELVSPGKANAWNHFVHQFSASDSEILFLMDADITILQPNVLSSMVSTLKGNPEAVVCVDLPVKDIQVNPNSTVFQRLLLAATPEISQENAGLCGQLYCAYSTSLRSILLPTELAGEDGFLRALLLTDGFTRPEIPERIVMDIGVSHLFASVQTFYELFKHERWIISCSIVNMILFERFWKEARSDLTAMALMKEWMQQDSNWLPKYINQQVRVRGWRLLPRQWWVRRWSHFRDLSVRKRLYRLPIALLASAADLLIFIAAIRDVRRGRAFQYWGRV